MCIFKKKILFKFFFFETFFNFWMRIDTFIDITEFIPMSFI